ncbi:MAG: substrate-binding domain-containing protein [Planctomycetes bacterium]|nr:substrate-binding domain-containing protein [Planctomycetota bacterium]
MASEPADNRERRPAGTHADQVRNVKEKLRLQILRNELPGGARLVEQEIKERTGSTHRAVRQALVELAGEGILQRRRHLGTFVAQPAANQPASPVLSKLGILTSLPANTFETGRFVPPVMAGIRESLTPPCGLTLYANAPDTQNTIHQLPPLSPERLAEAVQGLIALEAYNAPVLNDFVRAGIPVVAIDYCPPHAQFDAVVVDHYDAGLQAAAHLLALGHRRIGFIGEGPNYRSSDPTWQQRLAGYLHAMASVGGAQGAYWVLDVGRDGTAARGLLPDFQRRHNLSAYVLCMGMMLNPVLDALKVLGLECPRQVSLAAADGSKKSFTTGNLTAATVDYVELGRLAVRLMASRLACRSMPSVRVTLPIHFQPGRSSAAFVS